MKSQRGLQLLVVVFLHVIHVSAAVDDPECEEPHHKHYCVLKGHIAKELPPHEPPLTVFMDLGVSVRLS
jgi:hypothetical protein